MYYASNVYIAAKTGSFAPTKAYLWSTSGGKANWRQKHQQRTKPESNKIANFLIPFATDLTPIDVLATVYEELNML